MEEMELRWGIRVEKHDISSMWSIGACLFHLDRETYLYLNLIFCSVSIGKQFMKVRKSK